MLHNNGASFGPSSVTRTPGRSMIHNENENSLYARSKQPLGTNKHNSKSSLKAKTPLNGKTTNSRRRALGDISNRKGGGASSGFHSVKAKNTSKDIFIYTPHEEAENPKAKNPIVQPTNKKWNVGDDDGPKKKQVSFSIHSNLGSDNVAQKKSSKQATGDRTLRKSKSGLRKRGDKHIYSEEIELPAGRTWDDERARLGDRLDDLNLSIDIDEGLDAIRYIKEQEKRNCVNILEKPYNEEELKKSEDSLLAALKEIEFVDDDAINIYSTFEERGNEFRYSLGSIEDVEDNLEQLIDGIDDISL
jgi:hypothetical protein